MDIMQVSTYINIYIYTCNTCIHIYIYKHHIRLFSPANHPKNRPSRDRRGRTSEVGPSNISTTHGFSPRKMFPKNTKKNIRWCRDSGQIKLHSLHMGVSKNNGTPKSSILIGFSISNHPFWGTPIFGNTQIIPKLLNLFGHLGGMNPY